MPFYALLPNGQHVKLDDADLIFVDESVSDVDVPHALSRYNDSFETAYHGTFRALIINEGNTDGSAFPALKIHGPATDEEHLVSGW